MAKANLRLLRYNFTVAQKHYPNSCEIIYDFYNIDTSRAVMKSLQPKWMFRGKGRDSTNCIHKKMFYTNFEKF